MRWQSELKDLIWLELRARLTDRTITNQDKYLCEERKNISLLLDEIMNFRFVNKIYNTFQICLHIFVFMFDQMIKL